MVRALSVVLLCSVLAADLIASENPDYLNLMQRGRAEYRKGNIAGSEASFVAALKTLQRSDEVERAATLAELGDVYVNEDQLSNAERAYLESLAISRRRPGEKNIALILRNLGSLYSLQRRDDEALKVLQQTLKLAKTKADSNPALLAQVLNNLGVVYFRQGRHSKAESLLNQALQIAETSGILFKTPQLLHNLGALYCEKRNFKKAEELLKRSLQMSEAEVGVAHPDLTFELMSLAILYTEVARYSDAEDQYRRALKILEPYKSNFDTRIARLLQGLSATYTKAGRKAEAYAELSRAAVIARRNLDGHPDMAAILEDYSAALKRQGKPKEAEEVRTEARRARVAAALVVSAPSPF